MNYNDFAASLASVYKGHFPLGGVTSFYRTNLGSHIVIRSTLIEGGNTIIENDPMYMCMVIHIDSETHMTMELASGRLYVNPPEGSYLAMQGLKLPWRKTTGDTTKILKAYDLFLSRVEMIVKENEANIYRRKDYDDKYFV